MTSSSRRSRRFLLSLLALMHTYCRPHGSHTERAFIDRWILSLPGARYDRHGNIHVEAGSGSPILWSCHVDTVHRRQGRQAVERSWECLTAPKSECLGADDTAGVFLLRELVLRHTPGHYIFHRGEERGCIGSSAIVEEDPESLARFQCAIAIDRAGTSDIITHQMGDRTASDVFAESLSDVLHRGGLTYAASAFGSFTDTCSYAPIIPECSNLSAGYEREHSSAESLDCDHVLALLDALTDLSPDDLIMDRDPIKDVWREPRHALDWDHLGAWLGRKGAADRPTVPEADPMAFADLPMGEYGDPSWYLNPDYADIVRASRKGKVN